jgi:hypothetical protein
MLASGYLGLHPEKVAQVVLAEPGILISETAKLLMAATNDMRPKASVEVARRRSSSWRAAATRSSAKRCSAAT